ncbi:MAG: hypothetical protein HY544_00010 [Candidatus Diapherotrites archaeon]|uniref:Uncharacterized protein n=1 Tax=Candidatus Iainarchaeum sp. TaxID=3101447 RepID=A0A8T3YJP0_9ARCH|nr:hypothetical protein [Candidatus Diapherotrites archaeon]
MDNEKKQAVMRSVRRRLDAGASVEEIKGALSDIGVSQGEAERIIADTMKAFSESEKVAMSRETIAKIGKMIDVLKAQGKLDAGTPFRTYIPKLRKGGKAKVREIIADSPLRKSDTGPMR